MGANQEIGEDAARSGLALFSTAGGMGLKRPACQAPRAPVASGRGLLIRSVSFRCRVWR